MCIIQVLLQMENPYTWRHKFKPARIAIGAFDPRKRAQYMYNAHTVQQGATKDREPLTDHRLRQPPLTIYSLHKEDEEDGHLALSHLGRCEPLDDLDNSSSALWWLPILLISPTRSKRLRCSGREPQQLVIAALRYANVQFTSERAQFLIERTSNVDETELAIDSVLHCLDGSHSGSCGCSVCSHDGLVHLLIHSWEVNGAV
jgi:hypothetical protein